MTRFEVKYAALVAFGVTPALFAHNVGGPQSQVTGAPGELTCAQTGCHTGGGNAPKGNVQIGFSGDGSTYTPGVKQTITISFANGTAKLYGFEMSVRLGSNNAQAGDFVQPLASGIQVLCGPAERVETTNSPCAANLVEYIEHNRAVAAGTWTFGWTPPATDQGPIKFYVAGNAANGDANPTFDTITTAVATLTPGAAPPPPKPTISSGGVTTAFNGRAGVTSAGWTEIAGTNLMGAIAVDWGASDFTNGTPTTLGGVSVTINGKPAFISHASPTQLEVQAPTDSATGPVQVVVSSDLGTSDPATATAKQPLPSVLAPFAANGNTYVLAVLGDGAYAGPANAIANTNVRPAVPGEVATFYGAGFGKVATFKDGSDVPAGTITNLANAIANPPTIQIGSVQIPASNIIYQGLAIDAIGLYQFTVILPSNLSPGDQPITFSVGGVDTAQNMLLTVQTPSSTSQE